MNYIYGFNGQEKDDEVTDVTGATNTAMFWEYDTRLGRRWNMDPKPNPSISNYAAFSDNPILFSDPLGDTLRVDGTRRQMRQYRKMLEARTGNKYAYDKAGNLYNRGGSSNIVTNGLKSGELSALVSEAILSDQLIPISLTKNNPDVAFDRADDAKVDIGDLKKAPIEFQAGQLAHVLAERLNYPGAGGYANITNRTEAGWKAAHYGFAIPAESRVVTSMLKVPYGARTMPPTPTGLDSYNYIETRFIGIIPITDTYKMNRSYLEVWGYGSLQYKLIMGSADRLLPSSTSPTGKGVDHAEREGDIRSITK